MLPGHHKKKLFSNAVSYYDYTFNRYESWIKLIKMGTSETDAVVAYSGTEEEEEEYYEQEHLPPLLEDEVRLIILCL